MTSRDIAVFDPFMGSGTTIGEAHKLGLTAIGRDINPVAVEAVRTALGPMDRSRTGSRLRGIVERRRPNESGTSTDRRIRKGRPCDVLYYFWVMQVPCLQCRKPVDLFPSWVIARNALSQPKAGSSNRLPACGDIFPGLHGQDTAACRSCRT